MNNRAKLARLATWSLFRQAAAMTTGRGSALHNAATAAAFGKDPGASMCLSMSSISVISGLSELNHWRPAGRAIILACC